MARLNLVCVSNTQYHTSVEGGEFDGGYNPALGRNNPIIGAVISEYVDEAAARSRALELAKQHAATVEVFKIGGTVPLYVVGA